MLDPSAPVQPPDEDPRSAFVRHLPRKIVEIKATLGAVLADPSQLRMRDELRRRAQAVLVLARTHQLPTLGDGLQALIDALDEHRGDATLGRPQLDRITALAASLASRAELDTRDAHASTAPSMAAPTLTRSEVPMTRTLVPGIPLARGEHAPPVGAMVRALSHRSPAYGPARLTAPPADGASRTPLAHATQVLFAGSAVRAQTLLAALGHDADVTLAHSSDEALARARDAAPDVVVAEDAPPWDGARLAARMAADALVRFIPVIVVAAVGEAANALRARCSEAFDVVEADVDGERLRDRVQRALRGSPSMPPQTSHELGELTLDELVRALQDELRRGLAGATLPSHRSAHIPLGAGDEVLAATWEAIARIRTVVEERSNGAVRFDLPITPRGLVGAEVFSPGAVSDPALQDEPADDPLTGRRALIVDDDPAVLAQFGDLLRGAGMTVTLHNDGAEALEGARRDLPDVILADILMPGVDGFAFCRAIRRDVALRHTPVILLSWREDLLFRMRELGARASGYLRKESDGSAILARVRATLRSRARTLRRIADLVPGAEVRGRLERVGSFALLEGTARSLGDASVTLADAGSVTELELRQGSLVAATRTSQDGALARGEVALARALGLNAARFAVRRASHPVRENIHGRLAEVLARCARQVTALEEAVSGASLLEVLRVDFDADSALEYASSLPAPMRVAVERMVQGDSPRDMVLRDGVAPQELEPLLIELARRGAVQRVVGRNREDLAEALRERAVAQESSGEGASWETFDASSPRPAPSVRGAVSDVLAKITRPLSRMTPVDSLADAVWRELRDSVDDPGAPAEPPPKALRPTSPASPRPADAPVPIPAPVSAEEQWNLPSDRPRAAPATEAPPAPPPEAPAEGSAPGIPTVQPGVASEPPPSVRAPAPAARRSPLSEIPEASEMPTEEHPIDEALLRASRRPAPLSVPSPAPSFVPGPPVAKRDLDPLSHVPDYDPLSHVPDFIPQPSAPEVEELSSSSLMEVFPGGAMRFIVGDATLDDETHARMTLQPVAPEVEMLALRGGTLPALGAVPGPDDIASTRPIELVVRRPATQPPVRAARRSSDDEMHPLLAGSVAEESKEITLGQAEELSLSRADLDALDAYTLGPVPAAFEPVAPKALGPSTADEGPSLDDLAALVRVPTAELGRSAPPPPLADAPVDVIAEALAVPAEAAASVSGDGSVKVSDDGTVSVSVAPAALSVAPAALPEAPAAVVTPPKPAALPELPPEPVREVLSMPALPPMRDDGAAQGSWRRTLGLMAGVVVALGLSYAAMRWFLDGQVALEPEPTTPTTPMAPAVRDAGPAAATVDAAVRATPRTVTTGSEIIPSGPVPDGPAPALTANGLYRDAAPYLDGGALPEGRGVLVIPLPRRPAGPVEVSISRRPVGAAPLQRVLREGFYSVQFRSAMLTSNQFVVVRRGVASVLEPPNEH